VVSAADPLRPLISVAHCHTDTPRKFKQTRSFAEVMTSVFGRGRAFWSDLLPSGETISADACCGTLKKLRRTIQNHRRGLLTSGVYLVHDSA
jgi:hypothetical protein